MVNVWLYAKPDDYPNQAQHINTFIDSFKMDAGYGYTPKSFSLPMAVIAGVVAAVVIGIVSIAKKKKQDGGAGGPAEQPAP